MSVGLREAAERIGVSPRRVRAMIAAGQLDAEKVSGRWLVEPESLDHFAGVRRRGGPPWSPALAWAYLLHRDGDPRALEGLSRVSRHRVRQRAVASLALDELAALALRRAEPLRCRTHPSVIEDLVAAGVASGLSAASALHVGLGVRPGEHADVYVPETRAERLVEELALVPARGVETNAIVRVVPESAWRLEHRQMAPLLALAHDAAMPRWVLIGGLLVELHAHEHAVAPPRLTDDADVLVDVRASPRGIPALARWPIDHGLHLDAPDPDGIAHRFRRSDGVTVDLLAPDHLGERADLFTVPPARTIQAVAGTQLARFAEPVRVATLEIPPLSPRAPRPQPDTQGLPPAHHP